MRFTIFTVLAWDLKGTAVPLINFVYNIDSMEFNFIKTIISALVFGFFLFIIVNHIINTWFSGALHESDRNKLEGFADATETKPTETTSAKPTETTSAKPTETTSATTSPMVAATSFPIATSSAMSSVPIAPADGISNSEMISDLFDRVNLLLDKMRTLKKPYTDTATTVSYNRDLSGNMVILSNLKTLVTMGVDKINTDLQKNPGILELYPSYSGNDSIKQIISDLGSLDDKQIDADCSKKDMSSCDKIASATDKEICIAKIKTQCSKEIETSFLKRVLSVVDEHQRTIDKILKK